MSHRDKQRLVKSTEYRLQLELEGCLVTGTPRTATKEEKTEQ